MALITHDSELLTYHVAANPVPNGSHFVAVRDQQDRPLVFSLGNNGTLYAIREAPNGSRQLINLNECLGLGTKHVAAFEVVQDAGRALYLCYAVKEGDSTPLTVLRPFQPELLDAEEGKLNLENLKIHSTHKEKIKVSKIFMVGLEPRICKHLYY